MHLSLKKMPFLYLDWLINPNFNLTLHQQKKEIQRKGQRKIGRASHGCLSIVIEGQHPRCLWCSIFVPKPL